MSRRVEVICRCRTADALDQYIEDLISYHLEAHFVGVDDEDMDLVVEQHHWEAPAAGVADHLV